VEYDYSKKVARQRWWQDEETFGTCLLALFLDEYGPRPDDPDTAANDPLSWDPAAILAAATDAAGGTLPAANFDKLMGALAAVTGDGFYQKASDFVVIANALAGDGFDPEVFEPADLWEVAWAVNEVLLLNPPDPNDATPFAEEVLAYVKVLLDEGGVIRPPGVLRVGGDPAARQAALEAALGDDPELLAAALEASAARERALEDWVRRRLSALADQLARLPCRRPAPPEQGDAPPDPLAGGLFAT
jgi:hypothetical protein